MKETTKQTGKAAMRDDIKLEELWIELLWMKDQSSPKALQLIKEINALNIKIQNA